MQIDYFFIGRKDPPKKIRAEQNCAERRIYVILRQIRHGWMKIHLKIKSNQTRAILIKIKNHLFVNNFKAIYILIIDRRL